MHLDNVILVMETGGFRIAHWGDNRDKPDELVMKAIEGVDVLILPIDDSKHILSYEQIQSIIDALSPHVIIPCHYYTKGVNSALSTLDTADEWVDQQPDPIRLTEGTLSLERDEVKKMKVKTIYFGNNYVSE
jgi:L-ascorbate metabolism protein UlaG (beta-lactamase superfamily)